MSICISLLWVLGVTFSEISVNSDICYLYICVLKYFSDISAFLSNIGKCNTFGGGLFVSFLSGFVCV
jgi:hypothetical protein